MTLPSGTRPGRMPVRSRVPTRLNTRLSAALAALAAMAPLALPAANAQTEAAVVITDTRTPQRVDRALAEVTVIGRERIEAASGRTLADLLAAEPGVQVWSNGGLGKTASVSLRGLESRHTLLLVDGVRHGTATVGMPSWDNLPLEQIERIEIVRGPLSALYGSDAVGGVVQVFTRRGAQGLHLDGAATAGSQGHGELSAGARFGAGATEGSLRLQHRRIDSPSATRPGAPFGAYNDDDDGFRQTSLSARLASTWGAWRAEGSLLAADSRNRFDDGPGADAQADLRSRVLSLQLSGPITAAWRTTLRLGQSLDELDTRAAASPFAALGVIGTDQQQLSWEHQISTAVGTVLALLERVQQDVERPGTPFAVSSRRITAAALGLSGESGRHGWQASLRRDRNSQFGGQTTGSLAFGLQLVPGLRAAASYGQSFVAPSFNQLYFPNFGNPLLLPEEGRQRELSLSWRSTGLNARLAHVDNRIRSYISAGPLPANIPRVRVDGWVASIDTVQGPWSLALSAEHLNPVNATAGSAAAGKRLPRRVRDSARADLGWQAAGWQLGASVQAHGARFEDAANTQALGGIATLDLRADWPLARDWRLGARLNNALNKTYETVLGYPQPGRALQVSLRWQPR